MNRGLRQYGMRTARKRFALGPVAVVACAEVRKAKAEYEHMNDKDEKHLEVLRQAYT